jgi:hypothetical protein
MAVLSTFCAFSAFSNSYVGTNGKVRYDLVIARSLLLLNTSDAHDATRRDFNKYYSKKISLARDAEARTDR